MHSTLDTVETVSIYGDPIGIAIHILVVHKVGISVVWGHFSGKHHYKAKDQVVVQHPA